MTTDTNDAVDQAFDDLMEDHAGHMVTKEVVEMMLLLRDFLRERVEVTGNGVGLGEADVSTIVNGRHLWIYIRDRTPEVQQ